MFRKLVVTTAIVAVASVGSIVAANAFDFPATPVNSGPPHQPGIPIANEVVGVANAVSSPILQPILAPGGGAAEPAAEPAMGHHHHHHHHHKKSA